jgi:hypothetical protein
MVKIIGTPKEQEFGHYRENTKAFICKTTSPACYRNRNTDTFFGVIDTHDNCVALLFKFGSSDTIAYANLDDYDTLEDWAKDSELELVQIFPNDSDFSINITF